MKSIRYTRAAIKGLASIPAQHALLIQDKITQYAADPMSLANNVKRLQGRTEYRLRVGDYRVIFDEDHTVIQVLLVGTRGGVTGECFVHRSPRRWRPRHDAARRIRASA